MTLTLLLPIDGSEAALRGVDWLILNAGQWATPPRLHLLNVQPSLPGDITRFIAGDQIAEFHREQGEQALEVARSRLEAAGFHCECHVRVGEAAKVVSEFSEETRCDQILLGTRGHSGLGGVLLGSLATRLSHSCGVPLLLVR
jgi:nucleotide-binding universal stress UspA family protein